jgi:hypothetical protein
MELSLPSRTLHCEGVVSWTNPPEEPVTFAVPPGFGVRFGELSTTDRRFLTEYIRRSDTLLREERRAAAGREPRGV